MDSIELRSHADMAFAKGEYNQAAALYEHVIEQDPGEVTHYWQLGLALLLQGQESEAQMAWMMPLMEADPNQAQDWTADLVAIIRMEADRQFSQSNLDMAWLLRQHLREFAPDDWDNLLILLDLAIQTGNFALNDGLLAHLTEVLAETPHIALPLDRWERIGESLLNQFPQHSLVQAFLDASLPCMTDRPALVTWLLDQAQHLSGRSHHDAAAFLGAWCAQLEPHNLRGLLLAVHYLQKSSQIEPMLQSISLAEQWLAQSPDPVNQLLAIQYILTGLMKVCGSWQKTWNYYQQYKTLLLTVKDWVNTIPEEDLQTTQSTTASLYQLLAVGPLLLYFEDDPQTNRHIRNQVATLCQQQWQSLMAQRVERYQHHAISNRPVPKIGYLSDCLRQHSVGWIVRWLMKHHDREKFEIHLYSTRQSNDFIQQAFAHHYREHFHDLSSASVMEIGDRIFADDIDILVDLDSLTAFSNCAVMTLKPAPVQVSWLGFDASGIPAIDYYIVDPYVLSDSAQANYQETLWRLPQTYVAVGGFEVGVPELRRQDLDIPTDAIVYLSSQTGFKRNPDNFRTQLQILKQVPHSYFVLKSLGSDLNLLKEWVLSVAEEEGITGDRFRFLPDVESNLTYRANLGIADVILDTFPYNGATTTLEALWVGLPIVTRVGQQFAARNSYTMMMNAGITEGIAWSDEEYIDWGIRLGTDPILRRHIAYRLRRSRHAAPLWNVTQFTQEMESAYLQMWERYGG